MRWTILVAMLVAAGGCGGRECVGEGEHRFTATLESKTIPGSICDSAPASFEVTGTLRRTPTGAEWDATENGLHYVGVASGVGSCQASAWFIENAFDYSHAINHQMYFDSGRLQVVHAGTCMAIYSLH